MMSVCKVEAAYEKLKDLVLTNQLRPNEHLQINNLAERLRVGVTPLREALIRLTAESLIESHPHRGFFAKVLTIAELNDLSQFAQLLLRSSLHSRVYRFDNESSTAGMRGTKGSTQHQQSAEAGTGAVEKLYETIVIAGGNAQMLQAIRNYNSRVHAVLLIFVEQFEMPKVTFGYVLAVTKLLVTDDRDAVLLILQRWFDRKESCFSGLIKEATAQAFTGQQPNEIPAPPHSAWTEKPNISKMSAAIAAQKIVLRSGD